MATVSVRFNTAQMERAFRELGQRLGTLALLRGLNRAASSAKTLMVREVSRDMGLKVGTVRDQVKVVEARANRLEATVSTSGKRIPLIDFRATGPEPSRGRGRGVRARLPGGAGKYPHAFIARMASGHRGVFERISPATSTSRGAWSKNLPIRELRGPSIPHVFGKYLPAGAARAQEIMLTTLESEIKFRIRQAAIA